HGAQARRRYRLRRRLRRSRRAAVLQELLRRRSEFGARLRFALSGSARFRPVSGGDRRQQAGDGDRRIVVPGAGGVGFRRQASRYFRRRGAGLFRGGQHRSRRRQGVGRRVVQLVLADRPARDQLRRAPERGGRGRRRELPAVAGCLVQIDRVAMLQMKVRWVLMLVGTLAAAPALAEGPKIGFVDAVKLIESAPQGEESLKKLEQEFSPRDREIRQLRAELRDAEAEL